jgi:hypothetical protein
MRDQNDTNTEIERIERAMVAVAYIVTRHGPQYAPILDRLERELADRRDNDPVRRAERLLDRYKRETLLISGKAA